MMPFGRQFDFHNVIYHIEPCNVGNRRPDVVFTNNVIQNVLKNMRFSPNKSRGKF